MSNQIGDGLFSFQRKSIREFNSLLKDKDIVSIRKNENEFYEIKYKNGQIFKCKGLVVNNAMIYEKKEIIKKRVF